MISLPQILNAGYAETLPVHIRRRVQPTNLVALLVLLLVGLPFLVLTPIYFPKILTLCPIVGSLACISVLAVNALGGIRYSRLIMAIVPVSTGLFYNMLLCGPGEPPIPGVYLITLSFSLIPFVTLDRKEYGLLTIAFLYCGFIILGFPLTRSWLTLEAADATILRTGWLSHVIILLGLLTAGACMMGLQQINRKSEQETEEALKEVEGNNERLIAQQHENEEKTRELEQARKEEEKRQWVDGGVRQMINILRQASDMNEAYDKAVSGIVKYLKANQAGLFIVDRHEERIAINLKSCYAYERKKFLTKSIAPGEGLLGQVFLEQATLRLTEMPADYMQITSGLGQAPPKNLLIVPMIVNEEVEGLLEIASFNVWEDHHIELAEKAAQEIGGYSAKERIVSHTQSLLKQSQEQSEELRAAEEEMRQNQEELQSTQEEMVRQHAELQEQSTQRETELLAEIEALKKSAAGTPV